MKKLNIPYQKLVVANAENEPKPGKLLQVSSAAVASARTKALAAASKLETGEDAVVIGADTIVVDRGRILGKPVNEAQARRMLSDLSGRTHQVITGVAVVKFPSMEEFTDYEQTQVTFRTLRSEEIELYLSTGEYIDKAGAYGIQGYGVFLVEKIEGDYPNVVGLPIIKLYTLMQQAGVDLFRLSVTSRNEIIPSKLHF